MEAINPENTLNIQELRNRLKIDDSKIALLLDNLDTSYQQIMDELHPLYTQKDWIELRKLSHRIQGLSANMGAINTSILAKRLNEFIKNEEWQKVSEAYTTLIKEIETLITAIQHWIPNQEDNDKNVSRET